MSPLHPLRRRAFTLVELLVVIGIIALLISILLPALSKARRSGNTVKCLSNLRSLGQAFQLYGVDFKDVWPVAVHEQGNHIPIDVQRRWPDLIYPYIGSSQQLQQYTDIYKDKRSVIWGCPEWNKVYDFDASKFADQVRVGYAMNVYTQTWQDTGRVERLAYCPGPGSGGNPLEGEYPRFTSAFSKAADRLLLQDSVTHVVNYPASITSSTWWFTAPDQTPPGSDQFYIDASRHGSSKKIDQYNSPCANALFCDGHAATVSVKTAWNAIHNPGQDAAGP